MNTSASSRTSVIGSRPADRAVRRRRLLRLRQQLPQLPAGIQSSCVNKSGFDGCQAEYIRIPLADGTLFATPDQPDQEMIPSLFALSDVMSTGWHAAAWAGSTG